MSVGTAFLYIICVCFLCSVLCLILLNLRAVLDFIVSRRRGNVPYIRELESEEDTGRYSMQYLVCRMLLLASLIPAYIICSNIEGKSRRCESITDNLTQ